MGDSTTIDNFPVEDGLSSISELLNIRSEVNLNSPKVNDECRDRQNLVLHILERLDDNRKTFQIDYSRGHRGTLIFGDEEFDIVSIEHPLLSVFTEEGKKYFNMNEERFLNLSPVAFFGEECHLDNYRRTGRMPQELKN